MIDHFSGNLQDRGFLADAGQPSSSPGPPQPSGHKYLQEYSNYHYHDHHHHHQPQQQQQPLLQYQQCSQALPQQQPLPLPQQLPQQSQMSLPQQTPLPLPQQTLLPLPQQPSQKLQLLPQQPPVSLSLQAPQQLQQQQLPSVSVPVLPQQQQQPLFSQPQQPPPPPPPSAVPGMMCNANHQHQHHQHQQLHHQHQPLPPHPSTMCPSTLHPNAPLPQHNPGPSHTPEQEMKTPRALPPAAHHHPTAEGIAALKKEKVRLQEQLREIRDRRRCVVCLDKEHGAIFMPCTHLVACPSCAAILTFCPVCRTPVQYLVAVIFD